jgi:hypothetical protein
VECARTSAFSSRSWSAESWIDGALAAGMGLPPVRAKEGIRTANRRLTPRGSRRDADCGNMSHFRLTPAGN